jgi:cytochrome d ubiquinol oxidase subunit I
MSTVATAAPALAVILARAQFGFTIAFHILFPAFSIGSASFLAVLEILWLVTGRDVYMAAFRYWLKIFSVAFAMGVVSGLVMAYEIGTNWSGYSFKVGPILGPLLAWETLTAFFLEAGFLGIMIFGQQRVGKGLHLFATCMVAIGTIISASWILMANSWMQTPVGYAIGKNGTGRLPRHRLRGGRRRRLPPVAGSPQPGRAPAVFHVHVDGRPGDAHSDVCG